MTIYIHIIQIVMLVIMIHVTLSQHCPASGLWRMIDQLLPILLLAMQS